MGSNSFLKELLLAFAAGFIAVLIFHQGMFTVLHATGYTARAPFPLQPTKPFGVPAIWSYAFWGGVWGLIFAVFERFFPRGAGYWLWSVIFGALGPTLVAWFLVAALKGQPLGGGWKGSTMITGLLVNGAWGLGTALLFRGFSRGRR